MFPRGIFSLSIIIRSWRERVLAIFETLRKGLPSLGVQLMIVQMYIAVTLVMAGLNSYGRCVWACEVVVARGEEILAPTTMQYDCGLMAGCPCRIPSHQDSQCHVRVFKLNPSKWILWMPTNWLLLSNFFFPSKILLHKVNGAHYFVIFPFLLIGFGKSHSDSPASVGPKEEEN